MHLGGFIQDGKIKHLKIVTGGQPEQIIYAMSHVTFYFFPMSPCHLL